MPRRWSGLARVAVTGLAGGLLACAGRAAAGAGGIRRSSGFTAGRSMSSTMSSGT
jgi:hypothetical protein